MAYDIYQYCLQVQSLLQSQEPFVTVTLIDIRGSAPQIVGAKAIITQAGIVSGTVGGGKIEARVIQRAQHLLQAHDGVLNEFVTWNLQKDIGMTCGGEAKFFFEVTLASDWHIAVFGAGHIAQSLIPILQTLNCQIHWIDQRAEWLGRIPESPKLHKVCRSDLTEEVARLPNNCFMVLMTQGHATDLPVLAQILKSREAPYVGVLGSLQKAKVLRRDLIGLGLTEPQVAQFHCPMGLPMGNNTPPEIALSVVSQLIQERDRLGLIHQKVKSF